ncbi:MAG: MFS transporter, partial [Candidatus Ventricola sp.]|nr:MFS transporter [Candidatus Ventricola sp.]
RDMFAHTLRNMKDTLSMIVKNRSILFFVIAYFFYIDGVGTIIHMATVFGSSCGLDSMDLMVVLLVVQIVAFPFAILYGRLADRFGSRKMILFGIATYIVVCMLGFNLKEMKDFLLLAVLVGTAQGGIQALSRSFYGKLVPAEHASEYFGFFDVFGKFSAVIGPALFGVVAQLTGVTNYGALAVMFMFILGGAIFMFLVPRNAEKA